MNVSETLLAQVMEFVAWKTLERIIRQHKGDAGARTLGCVDVFRGVASRSSHGASRCAT